MGENTHSRHHPDGSRPKNFHLGHVVDNSNGMPDAFAGYPHKMGRSARISTATFPPFPEYA